MTRVSLYNIQGDAPDNTRIFFSVQPMKTY